MILTAAVVLTNIMMIAFGSYTVKSTLKKPMNSTHNRVLAKEIQKEGENI
jgi:hypothetical protein